MRYIVCVFGKTGWMIHQQPEQFLLTNIYQLNVYHVGLDAVTFCTKDESETTEKTRMSAYFDRKEKHESISFVDAKSANSRGKLKYWSVWLRNVNSNTNLFVSVYRTPSPPYSVSEYILIVLKNRIIYLQCKYSFVYIFIPATKWKGMANAHDMRLQMEFVHIHIHARIHFCCWFFFFVGSAEWHFWDVLVHTKTFAYKVLRVGVRQSQICI